MMEPNPPIGPIVQIEWVKPHMSTKVPLRLCRHTEQFPKSLFIHKGGGVALFVDPSAQYRVPQWCTVRLHIVGPLVRH